MKFCVVCIETDENYLDLESEEAKSEAAAEPLFKHFPFCFEVMIRKAIEFCFHTFMRRFNFIWYRKSLERA